MKKTPQKILSGRRVTLPLEFMERFQLSDGDIVVVREELDGKVTIIPAEVKEKIL